jgi:hypothetical protein
MKIAPVLCALLVSLWASLAHAADPVAIPGSRVTLVPPDGFALSKEFSGLQGDKASVLVVEIPAATYDQLMAAISSGAMAKQGVEITGGEAFPGLQSRAQMYRGRQVTQGTDVDKWLLLVDGGSTLTLLNVSAIKGQAALTDAQVRDMFKSVQLAAAPSGDPVSALPFTVTPAARFAHRQTLGGSGLILTIAPPSEATAAQPGVMIARTFEQPVTKERWPQAMTALLQGIQALKLDKAEPAKPIKVGDLEGLEVTGVGTSGGAPRKALVVQLFAANGAYALIGMAAPELFDAAEKDLRSTIDSFRLK